MMLKLKLQYFGHLMRRVDSLENTLMLGGIGGRFPQFLIGLFVFLELSCMSCLHILEINSLSVVSFAIFFSHSEGCSFTLFVVSFAVQKILNLNRPQLFIFFNLILFFNFTILYWFCHISK